MVYGKFTNEKKEEVGSADEPLRRVKHEFHEHVLQYIVGEAGHCCENVLCNRVISKEQYRYTCNECGFDLCERCFLYFKPGVDEPLQEIEHMKEYGSCDEVSNSEDSVDIDYNTTDTESEDDGMEAEPPRPIILERVSVQDVIAQLKNMIAADADEKKVIDADTKADDDEDDRHRFLPDYYRS